MKVGKGAVISVAKYLAALGLAVFLMFWVFQNIEWATFRQKFDEVDYSWVLLSMLISFSSYIARAYRWVLLINPFGYQLKTSRALVAVFIGYMANLVLPRIGEVSRCAILKRNDDIPIPLSVGTVITERIFDLIVFILVFLVTLILEFDLLAAFFLRVLENTKNIEVYLYSLLAVSVIGGLLMLFYRRQLWAKFKKTSLSDKVIAFGKQLWEGLLSFKKVENKIGFIVSTLTIWVAYFFMTFVITFAVAETSELGVVAGLSLLAGAGVAMIIPVQGGFGTYHYIVSLLLTFYGIAELTGTFFATLLHTSQVVTQVIAGVASLLISFLITKKSHDTNRGKNQEATRAAANGTSVEAAR